MKTLFHVHALLGDLNLFFWAESPTEAKELARQQGVDRDIEIFADRVWANNINMKYRGYVVQKED